jgi:hypothetical protein
LFTVGAFTVSRSCTDVGPTRSAGIQVTSSSPDDGHFAVVAGNPGSSNPVSAESTVDDGTPGNLGGTGNTANPDLAQSFATLLAPGGEARTGIFYVGINLLGTDCVFGYALFSP